MTNKTTVEANIASLKTKTTLVKLAMVVGAVLAVVGLLGGSLGMLLTGAVATGLSVLAKNTLDDATVEQTALLAELSKPVETKVTADKTTAKKTTTKKAVDKKKSTTKAKKTTK